MNKARASLEGWNRGDADAWLEWAHPDVEWSSAVARQVEGPDHDYRGHAEMRRFWDEWHSVWDMTIEITDTRDAGDKVVLDPARRGSGGVERVDLERAYAWVFEFDGAYVRTARATFGPAGRARSRGGRGIARRQMWYLRPERR